MSATVHNTTRMLAVEHQDIPWKPKPYAVDATTIASAAGGALKPAPIRRR